MEYASLISILRFNLKTFPSFEFITTGERCFDFSFARLKNDPICVFVQKYKLVFFSIEYN